MAALRLSRLAIAMSLLALAPPAWAQEPSPVVIGIAAPLTESAAPLGRQVVAGAEAAATKLSTEASPVETIEADTSCSAEGGARAADAFVEAEVAAVVGFLCTEALEAALPILKDAGIPTLDVGVRANRFTDQRERSGNLVWRIAPRSDAEAAAIAAVLAERWRDMPFGLVDDGTIYGRGLTDAVRTRLEAENMRPATVDNYRPAEEKQFGLARRLQRTGVTHLFIAGDRPDVAIIARDATELGLDLDIIGGESLLDEESADAPLPDGILAIAPKTRFPELPPTEAAGEPGANAEDGPDVPQGYAGPAYVATEIAVEAVREARAGAKSVPEVLDTAELMTSLGPVRFDAKGDSNLDLFRTFEWRGGRFVAETGG